MTSLVWSSSGTLSGDHYCRRNFCYIDPQQKIVEETRKPRKRFFVFLTLNLRGQLTEDMRYFDTRTVAKTLPLPFGLEAGKHYDWVTVPSEIFYRFKKQNFGKFIVEFHASGFDLDVIEHLHARREVLFSPLVRMVHLSVRYAFIDQSTLYVDSFHVTPTLEEVLRAIQLYDLYQNGTPLFFVEEQRETLNCVQVTNYVFLFLGKCPNAPPGLKPKLETSILGVILTTEYIWKMLSKAYFRTLRKCTSTLHLGR